MGEAMTTPTDDELDLLRLCDRVERAIDNNSHPDFDDVFAISSALKSRLTSQSIDEVVEECARIAELYGDGGKSPIALVARNIRALKSHIK